MSRAVGSWYMIFKLALKDVNDFLVYPFLGVSYGNGSQTSGSLDGGSGSQLTGGAVIGIAIAGVAILLAVLAVFLLLFVRRRRQRRRLVYGEGECAQVFCMSLHLYAMSRTQIK